MCKFKVVLIGFLSVFLMIGALAQISDAQVSGFTPKEGLDPSLHSVSGVISSIDIKRGTMQLSSGLGQNTEDIADYTVNLQKTLVTDLLDKQFLVPKDLLVGQYVTVESFDNSNPNSEEIVARNIIVGPMLETMSTAKTTTRYIANERSNLVGPRGSVGPIGYEGKQGLTGSRGESGVVLRGERGEIGPAGPAGEQGFAGPRGPEGDIARGPAGVAGPRGPMGQQGEVGIRGEQGESLVGYAGPAGAAGPRGERGPVGEAGAKGATLYGPSGPAGYAGLAGQQGIIGEQGSKGSATAGVAGLAGPSGVLGVRGEKGETGGQGVVGKIGYWDFYKEFNFTYNEINLNAEDVKNVSEIAEYMKENPSVNIGIDGVAVRSSDQDMNDRRVNTVRSVLIDAGVPPNKIKTGAIGDRDLRRDGRIAVFFTTV